MFVIKQILSVLFVIVSIFSSSGVGAAFPYFAVLPDMVKVGINYISLDTNDKLVSKSELKKLLSQSQVKEHPFVLATKENFDVVRDEIESDSGSSYTKELYNYVISNANALCEMEEYAPMEYVLDEEDSILPISREVFNRIVILGYAWQVTGNEKYAKRAAEELENVCTYKDWCPSHFLAAAEMALAVSLGYDWFFDYLTVEQKNLLAEKTYDYAIKPALSKNFVENWFTWSKNNWNSICYSGIGIASMVFSSYHISESAEFLKMCYKNMPIAFENFTPNGVYAEGSGYADSGMNAIVYFVATSQNYLGTDFGMSDIDGFKELGSFPAYISTPTGVFNFGDNKNLYLYSPALHWYASKYNSPLIATYQMTNETGEFYPDLRKKTERNMNGKENALSSLWFDRNFASEDADFSSEPKAIHLKSDVGQDLVLMRSEYLNKDAFFAGIKGGYNNINHGDLDIGTFVFDALGERWAEELGPGNYDAPNYFMNLPAGGRWKNYCKRAEGQNTLVINPKMTMEDQYALAQGNFTAFEATDDGAFCTLDMSQAYRMNGALKVKRSFALSDSYSKLKIEDNIACKYPSEIYWFMHTKADIKISADGKTAILSQNGKQIKATLLNDGKFSVMPAEALKGKYEYDDDYSDLQKLTVKLKNVLSAKITVTFETMI